jgi:nicotinamide riboside transporter PnuC
MIDYTFIITGISIIGVVANIYKKSWCFIIWCFTNAFWCIYDLVKGAHGQSLLFLIYFVLAIVGLVKWRKEGRKGMLKRC